MPQVYDMGPTTLLPLRRKACWGFFRPKNPTASAGFEPANLGTKDQHATPRPPKPIGILPKKNSFDTHFVFFCLTFASFCLPYKILTVVSLNILTPFSTVHLFNLGIIPMENLAMLIGEASMFLREKSKWEGRKCSFNDVLNPTALHDEIVYCRISL